MTTIVVVRHGETAWNRERRMQGWAPVPLDETGREQADAVGAWLADRYEFDAVHCSDLLRTRQTTELLLSHFDFAPEDAVYEMAWRERDIGVYQGLLYDDVFERFPKFGLGEAAVDAAAELPESGESLMDLHDRVTGRFDDLVTECGDDETRLVVSHGGPIYMLLGHVKGVDIREAVLDHRMDNCGVTVFDHRSEPTVLSENETAWQSVEQ